MTKKVTGFGAMTPEQCAEYGRQGGIKSGEVKRAKKEMRETFNSLLSMPVKNGKIAEVEAIKNFAALKGKNISVQEAVAIAMIQKALKGNVLAAEFIRDTIGEKPTDNMNMNMQLPVFFEGEDELED